MARIATREKNNEIEKLKEQGKRFYSISKADTIDQCHYQAFLAYVKRSKAIPNVYSLMGSTIHDVLEGIINGDNKVSDLEIALDNELAEMDMLGFDFPRDRRGGTSIRDAWIKNMRHFCKNFVPPKGQFETEQLFIYPLSDNRYVRGYIDLVQTIDEANKVISIWDWKTSSQFRKDNLLEHGRQLVLYTIAKEHEGYTVKDVGWIMLKYVQIDFYGKLRKNSKTKTKMTQVCDRHKIVTTLKPYIESDLTEAGYDELEIEMYISECLQNNSLDCLPDEIKSNYTIKPYVRKYKITDELKKETLDYINKQADIFESLPKEDASKWQPKLIDKDSEFFCNYLCDYKGVCEYIKKYNLEKQMQKISDDDLF